MDHGIACKICGNVRNNKIHWAKERLLNLRHEFQYLECASCYSLQIVATPANLSNYYPSEYYSFQNPKFGLVLNPIVYFLKKKPLAALPSQI